MSFTTTVSVTSSPTATSNASGGGYNYAKGLGNGAIAGIAVGVVVLIAAIVGGCWFRRRRQRQRHSAPFNNQMDSQERLRTDAAAAAAPIPVEEGMVERKHRPVSNITPSSISPASPDLPGTRLDNQEYHYQAYQPPRSELTGADARHEMDGAPPAYELAAQGVNNGPQYPSTCLPVSRANTSTGRTDR